MNMHIPKPQARNIHMKWNLGIEKNDINLDGEVNTKDLVRLMKYIAADSTLKPQDINEDGKLNSKDLVALMKIIAKS